ncbi:hypothetical protein HDU96_005453, partial [Phlyctochytrium bullatum]
MKLNVFSSPAVATAMTEDDFATRHYLTQSDDEPAQADWDPQVLRESSEAAISDGSEKRKHPPILVQKVSKKIKGNVAAAVDLSSSRENEEELSGILGEASEALVAREPADEPVETDTGALDLVRSTSLAVTNMSYQIISKLTVGDRIIHHKTLERMIDTGFR